jgi:cytochrome c oxidase cbb3-type subunit 4
VFLTVLFVGIVLYTLRPGSKEVHDDISRIPFRNTDGPRPDDSSED